MNILKEICQKKIYEINKLKKTINYKNKIVISKRRYFLGEICKKFNLKQIAQDYENAGASCCRS